MFRCNYSKNRYIDLFVYFDNPKWELGVWELITRELRELRV